MIKKIFLLLLTLSWSLQAQEDNIDSPDNAVETNGDESQADDQEPDTPETSLESSNEPELSFVQRMNLQDIQTMDYFALRQDLLRNGLDVTGNLESLRSRLLNYYQLPDSPGKQTSQRTITIKSASQTSYFIDENIEEGYVRFSGGVVLSLLDRRENVTHEINADEILFNQDQDLVTASGNVLYKMIKSDSQEEFTGSSLTFNISNWSGSFFQGISKRDRDIEGTGLEFSFSGNVIRRNRDDAIILYDGMITSSKIPDPYYSIRAEKIWVYAPGEWGLENASLHVGRVPVFYFPFFYQPGDEIFFNPVLSISPEDRRGNYVQTTTYIYGDKEIASSPLSFLQIAEGDSTGIPMEIRGLYLVEVNQAQEEGAAEEDPVQDWMWKIAFDSYSKMGFYFGTEFNLNGLLDFTTFQGLAGIGLTWKQFSTGLPFDPALDGTLFPWEEAVLETPKLFGTFVPFRYGWDADFKFQGFNLSAEFYSDPFFETDFLSRSENFSPFFLLGFGDPAAQTSRGTGKTSFSWMLSMDAPSFNVTALNPFISSFSPRVIESSLVFDSFDWVDSTTDLDETDSIFDKFFGLKTVNWLSTSFTLSGSLIGSGTQVQIKEPELELIPPWDEAQNDEVYEPTETEALLDPLFPNIPFTTTVSGLNLNLPYSFSFSEIKLSSENTTTGIQDPQDMVLDPQQTNLNLAYNGSFSPSLNFSNGIFTTALTTSYSGRYYSHLYIEDALLTQEVGNALAVNRNFGLDQKINLSLKPLWMVQYFESSSINYNLDFNVADYTERFTLGDQSYIPNWEFSEWNNDRISSHTLSTNLTFTPFLFDINLLKLTASYNGTLAPKTLSNTISTRLDTQYLGAKAQVNFDFKSSETEDWEPSDITGFVGYDFEDWFRYQTDYSYSLEEQTFETLNSSLTLSQLVLRFNLNLVDQFEFNEANGQWEQQQSKPQVFIPKLFNLTYNFPQTTWTFWRNRLELVFNTNLSYNLDPQIYTTNTLTFSYSLGLDFMDQANLTLRANSTNNAMFLYSDLWVGNLLSNGDQFVLNPLEDLAKSFYFWDDRARRESNFNLESFSAVFTQSFRDWDLKIDYDGQILLVDSENQYRYQQSLTFEILWKPIPEIKTSTNYTEKDNTLEIKTDSDS
jgi:hypothetical protein